MSAMRRVGVWRGGVRPGIAVPAPFVWRCLSGSTVGPFPHPPHRTGRADFPHPALGQDLTPSSTTRRAQAGSDVRARSARRGARVDTQINGDATELLFASSGRADGICTALLISAILSIS